MELAFTFLNFIVNQNQTKMKSILLMIAGILLSAQLFSQTCDTIVIQKNRSHYQFYQNDELLTPKKMRHLMQDDAEAMKYLSRANANYSGAMIFAYAGGFLIGWPLGTALGGGEPEWGLAAAGGGLLLLTIPLATGFKKNTLKAVEIYNKNRITKSDEVAWKLTTGMTACGPGIILQF